MIVVSIYTKYIMCLLFERVFMNCMSPQAKFEVLNILDFNNERKRMSVIVKSNDQITLYCKGAGTHTLYQSAYLQCSVPALETYDILCVWLVVYNEI